MTRVEAQRLPLGERIRWARKRKGISQEALALMIGTSRRHMIRLENGTHTPGREFRVRIAEATDQEPEFFSNGDEDDEESDQLARDLHDLLLRFGDVIADRRERDRLREKERR